MPLRKLFIANRGEIAIRIARAAAELGIASVTAWSQDDAGSPHRRAGDFEAPLPGSGPRAYLDIAAVVAAAVAADCDSLHPGYGFLSESAAFARAVQAAGLIFVGPEPETLELFGDKARARELAEQEGVPLAPATGGGVTLDEVRAFQEGQGSEVDLMLKAVAGGGGRGMRRVPAGEDPATAFDLCTREAESAFGDGRLFAERYIGHARHIEVQVVGDGEHAITLHDRECSLQRRHQKIIEIAPAPAVPDEARARLTTAALSLAKAARLKGLATVEFLLDADDRSTLAFLEVNPRLQVEHTVTEAVTGLDLVQIQLRIAAGASLAELGLDHGAPDPRGYAVQLRVNLETLSVDGTMAGGGGGTLVRYEPPSGPGVRVDGYGRGGYTTSPAFDSLIAKLVVHVAVSDLKAALAKASRAAAEFVITGVDTNLSLLRAILERPEVADSQASTGFLEANIGLLAARAAELTPAEDVQAQAHVATVFETGPAGTVATSAPLRGTLVALEAAEGETVRAGQAIAILEAMKMQHVVTAAAGGVVRRLPLALGAVVETGAPLAFIAPSDAGQLAEVTEDLDLDLVRSDLAEVRTRYALTLDENRPDAVARRRRTGQRTARENLDDLFDPGSFAEYGALAIAAQKRRRTVEDLQVNTPADGIITGVGEVNGGLFDEDKARCVGLAYDFTVLAGTQGHFNHKKTDRILEFAEHWKAPVIWFTEGGGGRPGDVDVGGLSASSLDTTSFTTFARLSGTAPRIAINSGRCFAGNAVFFGCADVTIATRYSNIGLGGPAMIEGGGLGVFTPDEIGPSEVHWENGALDLLVEDEQAAVVAAKHVLSIFQGPVKDWSCADQRTLRHLIPENRVRVYDARRVIETLADTGSWIELRGGYGVGMITGFLRIEGRPMGLIANDPRHLGGAIDSPGAEKGGRFLQLCDAFGIPVVSLCDTPGFMVGPDSEKTAAIRRGSRLFVTAAGLSVPLFAVVLRKGYGLGAQAMTGGDFSASAFTIAWPTAEFGPMGLEGAVRLGYRKELEAETDPAAREALFQKLVGRMYETGKAISVAQVNEIDAVIDPAETRAWLVRGLKSCPPPVPGRRSFVDVW
ncbi:carboxyl transferase domain-containing protein [Phenylobacterium aquaticum]|uniref:acetyl-CoA carboxylase family protein n=2 Tax=Phenylobacterium aquaticum TaxID=1763816 RepID=UPI0026EE5FCA|nr:carboxyl transferase domain-containing protein [Phenylobacterium aquaticum]